MKSIYKTAGDKQRILELYRQKQNSLGMVCEDLYPETYAGTTHVLACGPLDGIPLVLLHGINAGAPVSLEVLKGLEDRFRIYAVDTIGQAGKSAENRLPLNDLSLGRWLSEVMQALGLKHAAVVGVSYGAFILQKLMQYDADRISKAVFVVPSGFTNGSAIKALFKVSIPLLRFYMKPSEDRLKRFMDAFYHSKDKHSVELQMAVLTGVKVDFRRPVLLKAAQVSHFKKPVYGIFAGNDVFFPGDISLEKCRNYFSDFRDYLFLNHSKHIPDAADYRLIANTIAGWLCEEKQH